MRMPCRGKMQVQLGYDVVLDNTARVHIESIRNVTYLFTVTKERFHGRERIDTAAASDLHSHL